MPESETIGTQRDLTSDPGVLLSTPLPFHGRREREERASGGRNSTRLQRARCRPAGRRTALALLVVSTTLLGGCSRQAWRYVAYRLSPDRVATTGETKVATPGLDASVSIVFDRFAVPHLKAETERDAAFGLGYMHGRDRRFQLETLRRVAAGRMRELVGDPGSDTLRRLESFSRLIGLYRDADELLATAGADELEIGRAHV